MHDRDAGWSSCAVVTDGDKVVSTLTVLDEVLHLGGVEIPTSQIELVATDTQYEGRGLVRELMAWAHQRALARGQLVQMIVGITYFYRQFGYAYTLANRPVLSLATLPPAASGVDRFTARPATLTDVPAMDLLQRDEQAGVDVWMPHSATSWRWLLARDATDLWLVEQDGLPVAAGRIDRSADGAVLSEVAAKTGAAANALLRTALENAGPNLRVRQRASAVAGPALDPLLGPDPGTTIPYYLRVADAASLLEALRPALSARLAASDFADAEGEILLSSFRSTVRIPYAHGTVGPVTATNKVANIYAAGGATVPPDQIAPLLFGPSGIDGLARIHPDVYTGNNPHLTQALFPAVESDILTFHLP